MEVQSYLGCLFLSCLSSPWPICPPVLPSTDCSTHMGANLSTSSPLDLYRAGSQWLALSFHLHICLFKQMRIFSHLHWFPEASKACAGGITLTAETTASEASWCVVQCISCDFTLLWTLGVQWVLLVPLGPLSLSPQMWAVTQRMCQWRNSPSR